MLKNLLALTSPSPSDHYLLPFLDVVDGKVGIWDRACGGSCISLMFGCRGGGAARKSRRKEDEVGAVGEAGPGIFKGFLF